MATKKKAKDQNRKKRMRKAKTWVATYKGSDIIRDYGKMYNVDPICAEQDLAAMKASTPEQRELLKQAHDIRVQKQREEQTAHLIRKIEKKKPDFDTSKLKDLASVKKAYTAIKEATPKKPNPKRRCPNCGHVMKQQFIGLKHCKCGMSWSKAEGYFERTPGMVFALQRTVIKKGKNSIRTKQVPVIRYNAADSDE
jgi:rubrerythrin